MNTNGVSTFDDIPEVVADPLRFKYKLNIGEDAFQSLKLKKYLLDAVDAANGAVVGFGAAKSSIVASTFFAPSGFLGAVGLGTAATPIGWAAAAGVIGAGLSLVVGRHFIRGTSDQVRAIPDFINTPMDLLAIGLFDLIGMLSVKVALIDGEFHETERDRITRYFTDEWGYNQYFVDAGVAWLEEAASNHTVRDVAEQLARFKKENPDCNYATMSKEILHFLAELSEADGVVDERETMAIKAVEEAFADVDRISVRAVVSETVGAVADAGKRSVNAVGDAVSKVSRSARATLSRDKEK